MTNRRWCVFAAVWLVAAGVPVLLSQPRTVTRSFKTWGQYLGGAASGSVSCTVQAAGS